MDKKYIGKCFAVAVEYLLMQQKDAITKKKFAHEIGIEPPHLSTLLSEKASPSVKTITAAGEYFGHDGIWLLNYGKQLLHPWSGNDRRKQRSVDDVVKMLEMAKDEITPSCLTSIYDQVETAILACALERRVEVLERKLERANKRTTRENNNGISDTIKRR